MPTNQSPSSVPIAQTDEDAVRYFKDMAANQANIAATTENMLARVKETEGHFNDLETHWEQWEEIGLLDEGDAERTNTVGTLSMDKRSYQVGLLGPPLKSTSNDDIAKEVSNLLLRRDQDFTDALINVGRDGFLSDPIESCQRNALLVSTVVGGMYTTCRDLFASFSEDLACHNVHYYRNMIRLLRSQVFLSRLIGESARAVEERVSHIELMKEKYEGTIFTLQRQLREFHQRDGTVGRGENGEYRVFGQQQQAVQEGGAAPLPPPLIPKQGIIIVQMEDISFLRGRHFQLVEATLQKCKDVVVNLANAYEARRTNYADSNGGTVVPRRRSADRTAVEVSTAFPSCYMFVTDGVFNALAFAAELHVELNKAEWPPALLQMSRYSASPVWQGVRARVGVHYGTLSEMDLPEATAVRHVEGVQVEKCMRVASLATAGETVVSMKAWERYQSELTDGAVPPSKKYQTMRSLVTEEMPCGKRRGFKKGEILIKAWAPMLQDRKSDTNVTECEFDVVSFFGLEAGGSSVATTINGKEVADDDPITPEELLFAKETELTMLQQELDTLRLAVLKRDTEMDDLKHSILFSLDQLRQRTAVKDFYHKSLSQTLEAQLLEVHDMLSQQKPDVLNASDDTARGSIGVISPKLDDAEALASLDENRKQKFLQWVEEELGEASETPRSPIGVEGSPTKHKNVSLWRELNKMVNAASATVAGRPQQLSPQGLKRIQSNIKHTSTSSTLLKGHSILRVYGNLVKRFIADEENASDSANKAITEDQFISLYLKLISPEGVVGNNREYVQLLATAALDSEASEAACAADDSRLLRSIGGHLARMFLWMRQFKRKVLLETNLERTQLEAGAADGAPAKVAGKPDKGKKVTKRSGGGSVSPAANNLQVPSSAGAKRRSPSNSPTTTSLEAPLSGRTRRLSSNSPGPTVPFSEHMKLKEELSKLQQEIAKLAQSKGKSSSVASKLAKAKTEDSKANGKRTLSVSREETSPSSDEDVTPHKDDSGLGVLVSDPWILDPSEVALSSTVGPSAPMTLNSVSSGGSGRQTSASGDEDFTSIDNLIPAMKVGSGFFTVAASPVKLTTAAAATRTAPVALDSADRSGFAANALANDITQKLPSSPKVVVQQPFGEDPGSFSHPPRPLSYPAGPTTPATAIAARASPLGARPTTKPQLSDKPLRMGGVSLPYTPEAQNSSHGLVVVDHGVVQLAGESQPVVGQRLIKPGPVLHPIKQISMAQIQKQQQQQQQQQLDISSMEVQGTKRAIGIPTGMGAPAATGNQPNTKLYFALNAKDIQKQLEQDDLERRDLELQQQRIQEQLIHLRQLQAENSALMAAAAMTVSPPTSPSRPPRPDGKMTLGIKRLVVGTPTVTHKRPGSHNQQQFSSSTGTGREPNLVVGSCQQTFAAGARLGSPSGNVQTSQGLDESPGAVDDSPPRLTIDLPMAKSQKKANLVANIVSMHKR